MAAEMLLNTLYVHQFISVYDIPIITKILLEQDD